ncbi:XTP/dITP diphosphohydrolase [Clostridium collagenovorans DSM 3089]|uniref:XTP/dITP diphosphohydrolase n=1 Tax=Clostridium collagenovorans DSM 3089 TaxID=1121306 RepID=A0A1M5SGS3_9CLOT|nr:non-canonical purine NTP pyrophosphatase [Clostridium collagenovorans]SHH37802.1 XTP/dITP diphosphohydrolase [Clostridium collagenovorans DSM 3089]
MHINYVTGNKMKFEIAANVFSDSKITLIQNKLDTPEIQSFDVSEVAKYSAIWARKQLKSDVIVTDAGFYINGLNGFPGPYIKYINKWLKAEDILKLLEDKEDRSIIIKDCLVYCSMSGDTRVFESEVKGTIVKEVKSKGGSMIDRLVIPDSLNCTIGELTHEEAIKFWSNNINLVNFKNWINKEK